MAGDIVKIKGADMFRLKMEHYRIGFKADARNEEMTIEIILPRGDFYKNVGRQRHDAGGLAQEKCGNSGS